LTYLVIDSENTTWSKGDPHDQRNKNVCWSFKESGKEAVCTNEKKEVREAVQRAGTLVGFHLGYDLEWLWKEGIDTEGKKFFCCQVAEFVLNSYTTPYPSLNDVAQKYLNRQKLDVVEKEYWSKGINTDQIPWDILAEYARRDVELTEAVYLKQLKLIPASKQKLISLKMQDMAVLAEMRFAGMKFDREYAEQQATRIRQEIQEIQSRLNLLHNIPSFNWASGDHLSALLYGGEIVEKKRVPIGKYKSGAKVGENRYQIQEEVHSLPRLYKPIRGSELKKGGVWSTDEDTLKKLDDGTELIGGILKLRELSKLVGTYYEGIPELARESFWPEGYLYGNFNQCVAATGRLSSSRPNLQNISGDALKMFTSRWEE